MAPGRRTDGGDEGVHFSDQATHPGCPLAFPPAPEFAGSGLRESMKDFMKPTIIETNFDVLAVMRRTSNKKTNGLEKYP